MTNPPRASSLRPDSPRHRRVFAVPGLFLASLLSRYVLWRADRWAKQDAQDDFREALRQEMLDQYGSVG